MELREMEQRAAVVREAREWLGTPYHHHGRVKGIGVDCAQLLCGVFERASMVPHIDLGNYPRDWHLHRGEELFLGWLQRVGARRVEQPLFGDVAVFRWGRCFSHGAVMVESDLALHSYIETGVILTRLHEAPLEGREVQFWSLWQ
jgi:cell wall-associated NlpC family hydrolase